MSIAPASLTYLALSAALALVISSRHSYRALVLVGGVLLALSMAFWHWQPMVVTHPNPPAGPAGYFTWPLPVSVALVAGLVALWRHFRKPGISAALVVLVVAIATSQQGAWVA